MSKYQWGGGGGNDDEEAEEINNNVACDNSNNDSGVNKDDDNNNSVQNNNKHCMRISVLFEVASTKDSENVHSSLENSIEPAWKGSFQFLSKIQDTLKILDLFWNFKL